MSDLFSLTGKRILVTGATSGIGRASAHLAADLGAEVIGTGRSEERLHELMGVLGGEQHTAVVADLTDPAGRDRVLEAIEVCDGVVHAAGRLTVVPFAFIREAAVREVQCLNYDVPILLTQALLKQKKLNRGSSIVFISSVAAHSGTKGHALYSGTKAALEAAARCLTLEVAGREIRVNCIAPGMVRTTMAADASGSLGDEAMRRHEEEYPLGFGQPEDVAAAVCFLLSGGARWITGSTLIADGGYSVR